MPTLLDMIESGADRLRDSGAAFGHGTDNAYDESASLVLYALGLPSDGGGAEPSRALTTSEVDAIERLLERRIREAVPAPYLTGRTSFAGLEFKVDERALVPRSPIAELILDGFEPWVHAAALRDVLDLCTGGGCIGIATAVLLPRVSVDAVDISADALELASENARLHGVGDRVRLVRSDLFEALAERRYDLIVSNPPYVGRREFDSLPDEYRNEPELGLRGGEHGLDLVLRLLAEAPDHLRPGGVLVCEVGNSAVALEAMMPRVPFTWLEFRGGGHGVFLLEGEGLTASSRAARSLMAGEGA